MGDIWASVQTSWNTFPAPTVSLVALSQLISWNYFHKFISPTNICLQNLILEPISRFKMLFTIKLYKNVQWVSALFCCISSQHPRDAKNLIQPLWHKLWVLLQIIIQNSAHLIPSSDWNVSDTDNTNPSQPTHDPSQTCTKSLCKWATGQKLLI